MLRKCILCICFIAFFSGCDDVRIMPVEKFSGMQTPTVVPNGTMTFEGDKNRQEIHYHFPSHADDSKEESPAGTMVVEKATEKEQTGSGKMPQQKPSAVEQPVPQKRTILKWKTTSSFPAGEEIVIEKVVVDGLEIIVDIDKIDSGIPIAKGEHTIEFHDPRFKIAKKTFTILPKTEIYEVNQVLVPLPRDIIVNLQYNVQPPLELDKEKIFLVGSERRITLHSGMKVQPGQYELQIAKEAYESLRQEQLVYPGTEPLEINVCLHAKPVKLVTQVEFDIQPPSDLPEHIISLFSHRTQMRVQVKQGGSIDPGNYFYILEKPGYKMVGGEILVTIRPSEKPYILPGKMVAQERLLAFDIRRGNYIISPDKVSIDGRETKFGESFQPGKKYSLLVEFSRYKTVTRQIEVIPGPSQVPQVIEVPLVLKQD